MVSYISRFFAGGLQPFSAAFLRSGAACQIFFRHVARHGPIGHGRHYLAQRLRPYIAHGIDAGEFKERMKTMKALIRLRKEIPAFKSGELAFVETKPGNRVLEYIKTDERANRVKVTINAGKEKIAMNEQKVLFSRLHDGAFLMPGGVCISAL